MAVVVTFNRLEMLQRQLQRLAEVPELDEVLVVDNASTDGTGEWLRTQPAPAETLAENTGGAGGFSHGLERAVESGADLVWLMDDDGLPEPDCLSSCSSARTSTSGGRPCWPRRTPTGSASRSGCPAAPGRPRDGRGRAGRQDGLIAAC